MGITQSHWHSEKILPHHCYQPGGQQMAIISCNRHWGQICDNIRNFRDYLLDHMMSCCNMDGSYINGDYLMPSNTRDKYCQMIRNFEDYLQDHRNHAAVCGAI